VSTRRVANRALMRDLAGLPPHALRSLTWDQGTEMAAHEKIATDLGVKVYFCDPSSPRQRPSTRTRTACCATTSRRAPTCQFSRVPTCYASKTSSTASPRAILGHRTPAELFAALLASPNHPPLQ
jgi:transposase, IS30 family